MTFHWSLNDVLYFSILRYQLVSKKQLIADERRRQRCGIVRENSFSKLLRVKTVQSVVASFHLSIIFTTKLYPLRAHLRHYQRVLGFQVWFDNNGYHSMPTWLNILNSAALRASIGAGQDPRDYGIAVVNHPLNFTRSTVDLAAL